MGQSTVKIMKCKNFNFEGGMSGEIPSFWRIPGGKCPPYPPSYTGAAIVSSEFLSIEQTFKVSLLKNAQISCKF